MPRPAGLSVPEEASSTVAADSGGRTRPSVTVRWPIEKVWARADRLASDRATNAQQRRSFMRVPLIVQPASDAAVWPGVGRIVGVGWKLGAVQHCIEAARDGVAVAELVGAAHEREREGAGGLDAGLPARAQRQGSTLDDGEIDGSLRVGEVDDAGARRAVDGAREIDGLPGREVEAAQLDGHLNHQVGVAELGEVVGDLEGVIVAPDADGVELEAPEDLRDASGPRVSAAAAGEEEQAQRERQPSPGAGALCRGQHALVLQRHVDRAGVQVAVGDCDSCRSKETRAWA